MHRLWRRLLPWLFLWIDLSVVDVLHDELGLEAIGRGDFYILCPDNDVTRDIDERRIQWAADDIIRNRPALSRWHPDHKDAFAAFMASCTPTAGVPDADDGNK